MKTKSLTVIAIVALLVSSALAEDRTVSKSTLAALGLGQMEVMSDAEGLQVRGMSSNAAAFGASLSAGQMSDPRTPGNFLVLTDTNGSRGNAENAGLSIASAATQGPQGSALNGTLDIQAGNPAVQTFLGTMLSAAGQASNVNAGVSAATGGP